MYLKEPSNKSVTLTGLVISFILVVTFSILFVMGKVDKEPGPLMELLWTFAALYLGRRFTFRGVAFDGSESSTDSNNKPQGKK